MTEIDKLWDFNDPALSERRFRQALAEAVGDQQLEIQTQIARTYSLRRQFNEAERELDDVRSQLTEEPSRVHIRFALELGRAAVSSGNKNVACRWFEVARALANLLKEEPLEIDAIHMLGIADLEQSDSWNVKALEIARSSENPKSRKWLGSLLNNLGWSQFDKGKFDDALIHFEEALGAREQEGDTEKIRIAQWCIGRTYRALGRMDEALEIMRKLERGPNDVYVNEELAHLNFAKSELSDARRYAEAALAIFEQDEWVVKNEPQRIESLKSIVDENQPDLGTVLK